MTKISVYPSISSPQGDDILIGTDIHHSDATKNFMIQDMFAIGLETSVTKLKIYDPTLYGYGEMTLDNNRLEIRGAASPNQKVLIASSATGYMSFKKDNFDVTLDATANTDSRTYIFPDTNGHIALVETTTLQQVLDNGHDLVDGNNFQGTGAGEGSTGTNVNAFGNNAGINNTGSSVNAFGLQSASYNTGESVNALGSKSVQSNTGYNINAFGTETAKNNTGNNINAFGVFSAQGNAGDNINAFGNSAGSGNGISGATIFSNDTMPSYLDYATASTAITIANGGSTNCTYLYHDQTTNSIGAVRL